ncbi:hypothetical protein F5X98DRAFT_372067 [Xylaria grammica]|nr:hypothetical protein F5X98DRAFT_372067 [Xylaria grammica]
MTSLYLKESDIPDLSGKVAVITGGRSSIGLAAGRILTTRNATVHALDISAPHPKGGPMADTRPGCLGEYQYASTQNQQRLTDTRPLPDFGLRS